MNATTKKKRAKPTPNSNKRRRAKQRRQRGGKSDVKAKLRSDIRRVGPASQGAVLGNQQKAITIIQESADYQVISIALGYLSKAFQRGFLSRSDLNIPAYAFTYVARILSQFMVGGIPAVQSLPYWLLALGKAITPKEIPFQQGLAYYKWRAVNTPTTIPPSQIIGASVYGFKWTCLGPGTTFVNQFPVALTGTPLPPDSVLADAFQQLCQFMVDGDEPATRLISLGERTSLDSDVSAFALKKQIQGQGSFGNGTLPSGGIGVLLENEVPIFKPLVALYSPGSEGLSPRFYNFCTCYAGDGVYLGGGLSDYYKEVEWGAKRAPRLVPVDFLEFGDVLAQWVSSIQTAFLSDPANLASNTGNGSVSVLTCPLTLQEVMLCLRNTMMSAYKETQPLVQGIYPFSPASDSDNQFTPFVCGSTTCALEALDMHLPIPLIENIRSLSGVKVPITHPGDVLIYTPILGQEALSTLQPSDYSYSYTDATDTVVTVPSFASGVLFKKKITSKKGEVSEQMMLEDPISLIDGNSASGLVFINDLTRLKQLVVMWNNWLETTGLTSYSIQTGTFGSEKGISTLRSIGMLRLKVPGIGLFTPGDVTDVRLSTKTWNRVVSTFYANQAAVADCSQGVILSTPYEQVLSTWILPSQTIEATVGADIVQDTEVVRMQSLYGMPYLVSLSSSITGVTLSSLHATYAAKMTKAKLATSNDWEKFFQTEAAKGRGGILSGMFGNLIGQAFPAAKGIVDGISSMLPI